MDQIVTDITYGADFAHITFDQDFDYTPIENSGFYFCTAAGGVDNCVASGSWTLVNIYNSLEILKWIYI